MESRTLRESTASNGNQATAAGVATLGNGKMRWMIVATVKVQQSLWNVVGGPKYDPDKFYTKSTDGNGHYERIPQTKISPSLEAMLGELMSTFPTEYKSYGDIVRDALMHLVVYRKHNTQAALVHIQADIDRELSSARMQALLANIEAWEKYVVELRDSVARMVEQRQWNLVAEMLQDAEGKEDNESIPETIRIQIAGAVKSGWEQMRTEIAQRRKRVIED